MILGHERQLAYFEKVIARGRMAHAYLFYGPDEVGKFTFAKRLAQSFYCVSAMQLDRDRGLVASVKNVCGACRACISAESGAHPHVKILDTAHTLTSKKEKRKDIPIEDIRELKRVFSLAPAGAEWRFAIINEAEKMSAEAANAFLKLLEEPGRQTLIMLITESQEILLPTIRSRTQPIRFSLVPRRILAQYLESQKVGAAEADALLEIADGRPGVLMRMRSDKEECVRLEQLSKAIARVMARRDIPEAFRISERLALNDQLRVYAIAHILKAVRENMYADVRAGNISLVRHMRRARAVDRISSVIETTNVNRRLALDALFLGLFADS